MGAVYEQFVLKSYSLHSVFCGPLGTFCNWFFYGFMQFITGLHGFTSDCHFNFFKINLIIILMLFLYSTVILWYVYNGSITLVLDSADHVQTWTSTPWMGLVMPEYWWACALMVFDIIFWHKIFQGKFGFLAFSSHCISIGLRGLPQTHPKTACVYEWMFVMSCHIISIGFWPE